MMDIMKKILSLLLVIALCVSVCASVMAADNYVPSIGDKQEPEIVPDGDVIADIVDVPSDNVVDDITTHDACLIITSVATAQAGTNNIPPEAKEILLDVYEKLVDGSMKIPYDKVGKDPSTMEIRELFDISLICQDHNKLLGDPNNTLRVKFDLGVKAGDEVYAMIYVDGEWKVVRACENNGDGTVTVKLDELCPIVFVVEAKTPPAQTGDANRDTLAIYGGLLAVSLVAIVALFVVYRKKAAKE